MAEPVHPYKLVSLLLQYPDGELLAARRELAEAALGAAGRPGQAIRRFTDWYVDVPASELQARYVETFDFQRRATLHLTYHTLGDRRHRGVALVTLKQRYTDAGFELADGELPDYLPVMLEFAVLAPEAGAEVLLRQREPLELVRAALHDDGSPWAHLLDAVTHGMPGLTRLQAARVARMAKEGPPDEEVGLEPFAPPEVMPWTR